jgi:hypothetical protein
VVSGAIRAVLIWYVHMVKFHLSWKTGELELVCSRILNYASEKLEKILFSSVVTLIDYSDIVQQLHT